MVATQSFSISRRTLDVEDYIDVARRHAGWIAAPAFFGAVASVCVAFLLPNEYVSKATMQITPPQISENMVQTTISNSLNERIQQMEQELLSRTSLSAIIQDPHVKLYAEELKTKPTEDVIEEMKGNVRITVVALPGAMGRRATAFDIAFTYQDRFKAQLTVQMLMDKLMESNQGTQKNAQAQETGLLGDLLSTARADLTKANEEITAFKETNAGKLPEEAQVNIAQEAGYTEKMRSVDEQLYRDHEGLDSLETQKAMAKGRLDSFEDLNAQMAAAAGPGGTAAKPNEELAAIDKAIVNLNFSLEVLRKKFSDQHPDIKNTLRLLETYKEQRARTVAQIQADAAAEAARPKEAQRTIPDVREFQVKQQVKDEITGYDSKEKLLNDDIKRLEAEQEVYKKESEELNRKLKESTGLGAEYEDLRRAQTMAATNYAELLHKQQITYAESQLISRKAGENLEVLDPASLPAVPTKPNRYQIIGAGFAASIVLGFAFAGFQEAKDTSLKNLKDVRAYTNLPVLCSIPLLENTMLVKRKRRLTYLAWSAAVIVGAAMVSGAVVYYETITLKS